MTSVTKLPRVWMVSWHSELSSRWQEYKPQGGNKSYPLQEKNVLPSEKNRWATRKTTWGNKGLAGWGSKAETTIRTHTSLNIPVLDKCLGKSGIKNKTWCLPMCTTIIMLFTYCHYYQILTHGLSLLFYSKFSTTQCDTCMDHGAINERWSVERVWKWHPAKN